MAMVNNQRVKLINWDPNDNGWKYPFTTGAALPRNDWCKVIGMEIVRYLMVPPSN